MAKYGLAVDVEKCTGCYSCFLACKDEYVGNDYLPFSVAQPNTGQKWMRIDEITQGSDSKVKVDYIPIMCQHCADAPCIKPGNDGAVYRRADGIVIIDPVKAKGRKEIADSCPYGVIFWNETLQLAQKCTLCAHMIDAGEKTVRCAETCPTQALVFGDMDDPKSEISLMLKAKAGGVENYKPEFGTKPIVKYISLPKPFIAGEVLLAGKEGECIQGAKVTLQSKADNKVMATETDFLGDFEFKGLVTGAEYTLRAEYKGYCAKEITVRTDASVNLGELVLTAKLRP
jgi:Fe-S-cluster-containing dehydrogenase component